MDKIKAVLRYAQKDFLEEIDKHVAVIAHAAVRHEKRDELYLPQLLKAIATNRVIEMNYTSSDMKQTSERKAEPVGIYYQGSHWYLVAFCRLRNDYRNFRTDKITRLSLTDEKTEKKNPPLQHFIAKTMEKKDLHKVVIDVEKEIIKYFGEQKYYNGFVSEEERGDAVRMTFLCSSLQGFAIWFLLFGEHAIIIEPLSLNDIVLKLTTGIQKKIASSQTLLT